MDRWSTRLSSNNAVHVGFGCVEPRGDPWVRIADYEDTGLEPEEIQALIADKNEWAAINEAQAEQLGQAYTELETVKKKKESLQKELNDWKGFERESNQYAALLERKLAQLRSEKNRIIEDTRRGRSCRTCKFEQVCKEKHVFPPSPAKGCDLWEWHVIKFFTLSNEHEHEDVEWL